MMPLRDCVAVPRCSRGCFWVFVSNFFRCRLLQYLANLGLLFCHSIISNCTPTSSGRRNTSEPSEHKGPQRQTVIGPSHLHAFNTFLIMSSMLKLPLEGLTFEALCRLLGSILFQPVITTALRLASLREPQRIKNLLSQASRNKIERSVFQPSPQGSNRDRRAQQTEQLP